MAYPTSFMTDLRVVGLFDANVPNSERILIRPVLRASLAGWGIAAGFGSSDGSAFPVYDHVFWFPDIVVEPPSWIYVYTGNGQVKQTTMPNGEPAMVFHWQRKETHSSPIQTQSQSSSASGYRWLSSEFHASGFTPMLANKLLQQSVALMNARCARFVGAPAVEQWR